MSHVMYAGENDIEKPSLPHVAMNVPAYAMEAHYYSVYSGMSLSVTSYY